MGCLPPVLNSLIDRCKQRLKKLTMNRKNTAASKARRQDQPQLRFNDSGISLSLDDESTRSSNGSSSQDLRPMRLMHHGSFSESSNSCDSLLGLQLATDLAKSDTIRTRPPALDFSGAVQDSVKPATEAPFEQDDDNSHDTIYSDNKENMPPGCSVRIYHGDDEAPCTASSLTIRRIHSDLETVMNTRKRTSLLSSHSPQAKKLHMQPLGVLYEDGEHDISSASVRSLHARAQSTGPFEKGVFRTTHGDDEWSPQHLEVNYSLPCLEKVTSQAFRLISNLTLWHEFSRLGAVAFKERYNLVDCRYEYEFRAGHIDGAINLCSDSELTDLFFPECTNKLQDSRRRIPIFYCEFSEVRGPRMANALRKLDRMRNSHLYPHVDYPEMYVLACGYKALWEFANKEKNDMLTLCVPQGYTRMHAPEHADELRKNKEHRRGRQKAKRPPQRPTRRVIAVTADEVPAPMPTTPAEPHRRSTHTPLRPPPMVFPDSCDEDSKSRTRSRHNTTTP